MFGKYLKLSAMAHAAMAAQDNKPNAEDHWAVIIVGSNGYQNYRHHADGCHAYQIAKKNGIPEDQIIMFAYDDVANSYSNPFRGKLFNKPTAKGTPGVDVYEGCKIDYSGSSVSKSNILGVLKGEQGWFSRKKVLKSNENSKVFFYYADHGAPGLLGLPPGWFRNEYLYADELHKAVKYMHDQKMYKEMVMYVEACESGSIFENILEDDINVYALSAANAKESSWGTYCSPDDKVDGKSIGSCLGDLFSVNWMEDTDAAKLGVESLKNQFDTVQKKTTRSHVLQWGQTTIANEVIGEFEAGTYTTVKSFWGGMKEFGRNVMGGAYTDEETQRKNDFAVDTRDIMLHHLYSKILESPSKENQEALKKELDKRMKVDSLFKEVAPKFLEAIKKGEAPTAPSDYDCYRDLIENFEEHCGPADTYTMKYFKVFVAQCETITKYAPAADGFKADIAKQCQ